MNMTGHYLSADRQAADERASEAVSLTGQAWLTEFWDPMYNIMSTVLYVSLKGISWLFLSYGDIT